SNLCGRFQSRSLFRTTFLDKKPTDALIKKMRIKTQKVLKERGLPSSDTAATYFFSFDVSYSEAYRYENEGIWILERQDKDVVISKAADTQNIIAITKPVEKKYAINFKSVYG